MFIVDLTSTETRINALKEGRDVLALSPLEPEPFVSSGVFLYIEQVRHLESLTFERLAVCRVLVFLFFFVQKWQLTPSHPKVLPPLPLAILRQSPFWLASLTAAAAAAVLCNYLYADSVLSSVSRRRTPAVFFPAGTCSI